MRVQKKISYKNRHFTMSLNADPFFQKELYDAIKNDLNAMEMQHFRRPGKSYKSKTSEYLSVIYVWLNFVLLLLSKMSPDHSGPICFANRFSLFSMAHSEKMAAVRKKFYLFKSLCTPENGVDYNEFCEKWDTLVSLFTLTEHELEFVWLFHAGAFSKESIEKNKDLIIKFQHELRSCNALADAMKSTGSMFLCETNKG